MPRIGGNGGPIIPPQAQEAQNTQQTQKSEFASKVQQATTQGTDAARAQQAKQSEQARLAGKAKEIAKRLANGQLQQKEATREFVALVIEERFPQFKKKKRQKKDGDKDDKDGKQKQSPEEQLEEAVTELIDADPSLAKRLQAQFKKLAEVKG